MSQPARTEPPATNSPQRPGALARYWPALGLLITLAITAILAILPAADPYDQAPSPVLFVWMPLLAWLIAAIAQPDTNTRLFGAFLGTGFTAFLLIGGLAATL